MEMSCKNTGVMTPMKESYGYRSKNQECSKLLENFNPNVSRRSPGSKTLKSPVTAKSAKSLKSASKNPSSGVCLPQNKIRQRRFVTAKNNPNKEDDVVSSSLATCKCKDKHKKKCLCVAYANLRASQEEFLKNQADEQNQSKASDESEILTTIQGRLISEDGLTTNKTESPDQVGSSTVKRRRDKLMEEARKSVPEGGCGRVMHLVKAFEKLLTIPSSKDGDEKDEAEDNLADDDQKKATKWALPGLQPPPKAPETEISSSSFYPSDLFVTSESLGLDPPTSFSSSCDDNSIRESISSRTSTGGQRSRRNSLESSCTSGGRRRKKKHVKATSQKPFKLRTEQRGKLKEEEFTKKLQDEMIEEEKQRIPVAQGLPWTTEEPENLVKPVIKESTRPVDLKLHTELRAIDRAEFDHQVAEKCSFIEQFKMERERQQKLEEEEEIRRRRKELIPRAQPMPYFDRPFIPRRSRKPPTIPREPKFQSPQNQHQKDQMLLIME
ncbi:uncharacterized protein LOC114752068 [Neltuma alba]|uniref:uncharacterized protein LOC114752068 n=1 Tax=Neltuma alba TaxID=207710 RepID=UPI0010A2FF7D|nr:uncharacterized protein LOC114752068 [Prosopis alba]